MAASLTSTRTVARRARASAALRATEWRTELGPTRSGRSSRAGPRRGSTSRSSHGGCCIASSRASISTLPMYRTRSRRSGARRCSQSLSTAVTVSTSTCRGQPRPSSLTSEGLFAGVFSRGDAAAAVSDEAWLQAMLDFEVALARACARAELIEAEAAEAIARAAAEAQFDPEALGRAAGATGNPVVGLLDALRHVLPESAAAGLHYGATSQDVIDTAMMLVTKRALEPILDDAAMAAACGAALADRHRETRMIGRTLLQQALSTTFGLKAAVWLSGIDLARRRLAATADECLVVQLGGAVGTLEAFGDK